MTHISMTAAATTLYKFTNTDGTPCNGGTGRWHLPTQDPDGEWQPGRWMRKITNLEPCERGYHLCREQDLLWWLGPTLWEAEADGKQIEHGSVASDDSKLIVQRARLLRHVDTWNDRTARLFAADCAEHVLPIWYKYHPEDHRPRTAIEVTRRFANGEATREELAAARDAAWAAARDAAWDWQRTRLAQYIAGEVS